MSSFARIVVRALSTRSFLVNEHQVRAADKSQDGKGTRFRRAADHARPCRRGDRVNEGDVAFSNRPSGVKHFQAIHHSSVDVAHGLALLFGLGTKALPSWDSKTRWNNLLGDLVVSVTAGSRRHTNSPHPSSREGHHSTVRWISGFLLSDLILSGSHAAATSLVHRKSVPSTQMRCIITA